MCAIGMRRRFDDALDNLATNRFVAPLKCFAHSSLLRRAAAHGALARSCAAVGNRLQGAAPISCTDDAHDCGALLWCPCLLCASCDITSLMVSPTYSICQNDLALLLLDTFEARLAVATALDTPDGMIFSGHAI